MHKTEVEQYNMSDSKLAAALDLAAMGFRVFPLLPGGKMPAAKGWPGTASADPARVRDMWVDPVLEWESDSNIGVLTGDGLLVIDIDTKKHDGFASLLALELENDDLPRTPTAITPSGSQHVYLRDPAAATRNSASRIAPGVDIRAHHGYVVGPGSIIGGTPYRWLPGRSPRDLPIADAPDWLVKLCGQRTGPAPGSAATAAPAVELDSEFAIARARRYLQQDAPPSIEGAGGNENAFRVCCVVKDMGVSEIAAIDLMLDHWNERCAPPWAVDELADIAAHAWRYGTSRPGAQSPAADFAGVAMAEPPPAEPTAFQPSTLPADFAIEDLPPRRWTSGRRLGPGLLTVMGGAPGTSKSTLCVATAVSIATGSPVLGETIHRTGACFLHNNEDDIDEMRRRLVAACKATGQPLTDVGPRVHMSSGVLKSLVLVHQDRNGIRRDDNAVKQVIAYLREHKIAYAAFDPLVSFSTGVNENDNGAMNFLMETFARIAAEADCAVEVVHHFSKDGVRTGEDGAGDMTLFRGGGAIVGKARIAYTLTRSKDGVLTARSAKGNLSRPWSLSLALRSVDLRAEQQAQRGFDDEGARDDFTAPAIVGAAAGDFADVADAMPPVDPAFVDAVYIAIGGSVAPLARVREVLVSERRWGAKSTVYDRLGRLCGRGPFESRFGKITFQRREQAETRGDLIECIAHPGEEISGDKLADLDADDDLYSFLH